MLKLLAEQGVDHGGGSERAARSRSASPTTRADQRTIFPAFLDLVRRQLRARLPGRGPDRGRARRLQHARSRCCRRRPRTRSPRELERLDKSGRKAAKGLEGVDRRHDAADRRGRRGRRRAARASFDGFNRALDMQAPDRLAGQAARVPGRARDGRVHAGVLRSYDEPVELKLRTWQDLEARATSTSEIHGHGDAGACADAVVQPRDRQPRASRSGWPRSPGPTCSSASTRHRRLTRRSCSARRN